MQSKGAIRFVTILVLLACLYQLSFTLATKLVERKAKSYAEELSSKAEQSEAYKLRDANTQRSFLDSIKAAAEVKYLDSVSGLSAYPLGLFTYKECKEKEINLGLDLKGGMNVTLEVSVVDLIKALAGDNSNDATFKAAIDLALKNQGGSGKDFVTLFGEAWNTVAPQDHLSRIFGTFELKDKIKPTSTNDEVLKVIRTDAESAIANSFNVLRNRIDRFGVSSPSVQRLGNSGRILVELPGIKEPERVRKLLQGTANLEFWETYNNLPTGTDPGMYESLLAANQKIREINEAMTVSSGQAAVDTTTKTASAADTTGASNELLAQINSQKDSLVKEQNFEKMYPLFALLHPSVDNNGAPFQTATIGRAHARDTARINKWLSMPQVREYFPKDFSPAWTIKPDKRTGLFELIGIKKKDGKAPLDGAAVVDAHKDFSTQHGSPEVSMTMNPEGAKIWAHLTADNAPNPTAGRPDGNCIAIVLDDYVYSYPRVNQEITGGQSRISGDFTVNEADDLANVLKSGKLPVPARIVQEAVVGPSLGQESINAGMFSFILAFLLVLLYMWFYYNGAGMIANIALLTNVILLFGTLVSFGAVLTLPGIAGIVLTMGMAVDANVLIFERIKEELRAGKGLRIAVTEGYKNALSAIIDGQLTTLITGIVLFLFGSGPVQGFATTLIIGILTSLATSIFVSRLIIEWWLGRGKVVKFSTKLTENVLQHTKIDFLKMRKVAYGISIVIIAIGITSMVTKGFSYGVDFTGGRTYVVRFDQDANTNDIRESLLKTFNEASEVKQFGPSTQVKITTKYKIKDQAEEVDKEVEQMLYAALQQFFVKPVTFDEFISTQTDPNGIISSEKVGPTIADDLKVKALFAVFFSLIAIFAYIALRFRKWQWGFGGVLSLAHDALVVISIFSIFSGILPFSMDIDQQFIAAILTIIGYSINDTVVIFDRIREYRHLYPKRKLYDNINHAINSTLMRTINTSMTVLIVLLAIFIFGGEVIRGFSFALIVGVVMGCYSTVFIAIPVSYDCLKGKEAKELDKKKS